MRLTKQKVKGSPNSLINQLDLRFRGFWRGSLGAKSEKVSKVGPKNLFGLFLTSRFISNLQGYFGDPPKIPFKTSIKLTCPRLFLPRKVIFALQGKRLKIARKDSLGGPQKSEKKSRKGPKSQKNSHFPTSFKHFETLFRTFGTPARETYSRLFGFWPRSSLLPGPRNL